MEEVRKTAAGIEDAMAGALCMIWGIENTNGRIRAAWGSGLDGAPMSAPKAPLDADVCYIQATHDDDGHNRQQHIRFVRTGRESGPDSMTEVNEHTDVWEVLFVNYGPGAFDFARRIRNGLYRDALRRFFRINRLALLTDVPALRRVPEMVNGSWANRVDVSARFNQYVRVLGEIGTIERVGVTPVADGASGGQDPGRIGASGKRGLFVVPDNGNVRNVGEVGKGAILR